MVNTTQLIGASRSCDGLLEILYLVAQASPVALLGGKDADLMKHVQVFRAKLQSGDESRVGPTEPFELGAYVPGVPDRMHLSRPFAPLFGKLGFFVGHRERRVDVA